MNRATESIAPIGPITSGWRAVGSGGASTGAQNYDEFADDAEITAIVAANPSSLLAVEMPHRTPAAVAAGAGFAASLPAAVERFAALRAEGALEPFDDAVALYRIGGDDGRFVGMFCLVGTDQISTAADEPGLVIRNEDVFIAKVAQRAALTEALGVLTSPVLLVRSDGFDLDARLRKAIDDLGAPAVRDVDHHGVAHEIWLLGPGPDRAALLAVAGGGDLVVADGNHRSLAAQQAGLATFLAVVTTPESVTIASYNRLVRTVPDGVFDELTAGGAAVSPAGPLSEPAAGTVVLYSAEGARRVRLPGGDGTVDGVDPSRTVDGLDHSLVERVLFGDVLGLAADDPAITYVGGDYPASWLTAEVDAGRAALAVLIAPVTVDAFVAVNLARAKMPRKSTWFVPKARTGLVLAEVEGQ